MPILPARHPDPAHPSHRLCPCAGGVRRAADRHRPQRPRHRRRRARARSLGDRGGALAVGGRHGVLGQCHEPRRPADGDRRLPRRRHPADRRCRRAAAAQGEPETLHRHGRRSRRLLRRQGAGRAAGVGHPGRPARSRGLGAAAAARHGRGARDLDAAQAGRSRQPARRAASRHRPRLQGGQGGDRGLADRARPLREGRRCRRQRAPRSAAEGDRRRAERPSR